MANTMKAKNKREGKKNSANMELRPTICLFVEHNCRAMGHALYMIHPPLDLSDYDQMIDPEGFMADSKYISPVLTFPKKNNFLTQSACINLGSKIYFFGGRHDHVLKSLPDKDRLTHQFLVFDTNHPEQGMRSLAPMNGPKQSPCSFVADGMIYALGSAMRSYERIFPGCKGTGFFERYDPSSDEWGVLPDPPLPFRRWVASQFIDCATVVGRRVFIGSPSLCVIFNLDTQDWDPLPPPNMAARFPCGSLFVPDTASLYHLRGPGVWKPGTIYRPQHIIGDLLQLVKRGPLTATKKGVYNSELSSALVYGKEQVMAADIDLEENTFFTDGNYLSWRDLFHMGGRFFCYVATASLVHRDTDIHYEPYSRGVWIKFFEEVPARTHDGDKARFRPLASFGYKIDTDFPSMSRFIRCSVLGTVPDSWVKSPLKKNQDSKLKHTSKESEALEIQIDTALRDHGKAVQLASAENTETSIHDLKKLLAVREEENSRLAAELSRKNELLKSYEALLATGGMTLL